MIPVPINHQSDLQMQHPPEVPIGTYGWVIILSWWGATARYLQAIKAKGCHAFSWWVLAAELTTSGLVGLVVFYLADWQGLDPRLMAALIAISGHFSTRAIFVIRHRLLSILEADTKDDG